MQLVISDSSTLIHLAAINRFALIRLYYPSVIIPRAVYEEVILMGRNKQGSGEVVSGIDRGEIIVREVQNTRLSTSLQNEIHRGEAEVIALAMESDNTILFLDDLDARRVAHRFALTYTGVLGILIRARLDGNITALRNEIEELRTSGKFWVSDVIMQKALMSVGEE